MIAVLSRRVFMGLAASALVIARSAPFSRQRKPYVRAGDCASYVGAATHPAPCFIGSSLILDVAGFDGIGFPCTVQNQSFGVSCAPMETKFYDFDLSDFNADVPANFWHSERNTRLFPNLHSFVRWKRFGENPARAWSRLGGRLSDFAEAA